MRLSQAAEPAPVEAAKEAIKEEAVQEPADVVSYHRDVRPVLRRHCWGCHHSGDPQGGLNLDTVATLKQGGDSGAGLIAGKPDASLLMEMISGDSPEMPKKQPPLSAAKIALLRQWVLSGAVDDSPAESAASLPSIPEAYRIAPPLVSVALDPAGQMAAAACRSEVLLFAVDSQDPPRRLPTDCDLLTHVEFSPDGKLLAVSGGSPARFGEVRFYQASDGQLLSSRRLGNDTFFGGGFAPDSSALAVGGADGAVHIVPVDEKKDVRKFDLHSDWVLDVAYTPQGDMIVSSGRDKSTKICQVATGELLRTLDDSSDMVHAVAADQDFAVSAGKARQLIRFELKTALANIVTTGSGNGARPISTRAQYARNFEALPGEAFDIAVSGDKKLLAAVGGWGDVRVFELATQKRVALIPGLTGPVYAASLNQDGTRLAIGLANGQMHFYSLPSGELIRSLTPAPVVAAGDLP
ncbi:WD domain, G-beta repeat [Lignipirellula cremea]|uniref:WD domain, G-beta repeat n=2 Tax=Lignipirellula cremea TaxID=2528010 RepID=A0A518DUM4_9BACT|nr:WD domain, G-beta repeat [Lignipirellula cremea]